MQVDRYVYPGTDVLVNKFGCTDKTEADRIEREASAKALMKLDAQGITGRFDVGHIRSIHVAIFGDVYTWAGDFREIQIWKGGTEFVAPEGIEAELQDLCDGIREKNYFRDMPKDEAANAMADTMAALNQIHPFREGNGRTQRMFLGQLALNAGYELDFTKMSENDMRNASMSAARGNNNLMRYLFRSSMSEVDYDGPVKAEPKAPERAPDAPAQKPGMWSRLRAMLHGRDDNPGRRDDGLDGP